MWPRLGLLSVACAPYPAPLESPNLRTWAPGFFSPTSPYPERNLDLPIKALVAELGRRRFLAILGSALLAIQAKPPISSAQDKAGFPDGFDAPEAAPDSHKVIVEKPVGSRP